MAVLVRMWKLLASLCVVGLVAVLVPWLWLRCHDNPFVRQPKAQLDRARLNAALDEAASRNFDTRLGALWTLALSRRTESFETLRSAALDRHPQVRQIGVLGLGLLGVPKAKRLLINALRDSEPGTRDDAAWGLSRLSDEQGTAALAQRWIDSEPVGTAFGSTLLLGLARARGPASATELMAGQFSHGTEWGKVGVANRVLADVLCLAKSPRAIEQLKWVDLYQGPFSAVDVAGRLPECLGIPYLVQKAAAHDERVTDARGQAMLGSAVDGAIARMTEPCVADKLLTLLSTSVPADQRKVAAKWLRSFASGRALEQLVIRAADPDPEVRAEIERTLRIIGPLRVSPTGSTRLPLAALDPFDSATGPELMKALGQASGAERLRILDAMVSVYGQFGTDRYAERQELLERLAKVGFPNPTPIAAWLGPPEIDTLTRGLVDSDPKVADLSWRLIRNLGDHRFLQPVLTLLDTLPGRLSVGDEITRWIRPEDIGLLAGVARSGSVRSRVLAIKVLGTMQLKAAQSALLGEFEDALATVRAHAYYSYAKSAGRDAVSRLAARLAQAVPDEIAALLTAIYVADVAAGEEKTLETLASPDAARSRAASKYVVHSCYAAQSMLFRSLVAQSRGLRETALTLLESCYQGSGGPELPIESAEWRSNVRRALLDRDLAFSGRLSCVLACRAEGGDARIRALSELDVNRIWLNIQRSGAPSARDCASRLLAAVGDENGLLAMTQSILQGEPNYSRCAKEDTDCLNSEYYAEVGRVNSINELFEGHVTPRVAQALEKLIGKTDDSGQKEFLRKLIASETAGSPSASQSGASKAMPLFATAGASTTSSRPSRPLTLVTIQAEPPFLSDSLVRSKMLTTFLATPGRAGVLSAMLHSYSDQALDSLVERQLGSLLPGEGAELLSALADSERVVSPALLMPHVGHEGVQEYALKVLARTRAPEAIVAVLAFDMPREFENSILKYWGDSAGIDGLLRALTHENSKIRAKAAFYLGKLRTNRSVEPLLLALEDNNNEVRAAAAETLGKLSDRRASSKLAQLVLRSASGEPGYFEGLKAWVRLCGAPAEAVLEECTRGSNRSLAATAAVLLERVREH